MSLTMPDFKEKRDFIRMPIGAEITLSSIDNSRNLPGLCTDLSGGGMAFEVSEALTAGTELKTSLPSTNTKFPSFETKIRVIRCTELSGNRFQIGAEIVEVI